MSVNTEEIEEGLIEMEKDIKAFLPLADRTVSILKPLAEKVTSFLCELSAFRREQDLGHLVTLAASVYRAYPGKGEILIAQKAANLLEELKKKV